MYECKVLADSIDFLGHRLTTFQVTFPRFILAEVNTHRMLSRNSASSRAIPIEKIIQMVEDDPFIPEFNHRVTGMGVGDPLSYQDQEYAQSLWLDGRNRLVEIAGALLHLDKSRVNRLLETWNWHTAIVTATDWSNFFALRTDEGAQPEFRKIALMMKDALHDSEPRQLASGEWHLPLVDLDEMRDDAMSYPEPFLNWELWKKVSIGRCARVSYLTHDGRRDIEADVALHDRLKTNGHLSPFEHVARPFSVTEWDVIHELQEHLWGKWYLDGHQDPPFLARLSRSLDYCGNLHGWHQARYDIPFQHDFALQKTHA